MQWAQRNCVPCEGGVKPLEQAEASRYMADIHDDWTLSDDARVISRQFQFVGFNRPIMFANAVAFIAAEEGHHPELIVEYGACTVRYWTHAIDGLSDNDFICAAKVDRLLDSR